MTGPFLTRRGLLLSGSAAAILAALPEAIEAVAPLGPEPIAGVNLQAFVVGTPGEYNWQHVVAESAEAAFKEWAKDRDWHYEDEEQPFDPEYVTRVPEWDGRAPGSVRPADWLDVGLGHCCERCGYETHPDAGCRAVRGEVVCEECLTILDRAIVDPDDVVEDLENRIADEGAEDVRAWLEANGWWSDLPPNLWNQAVARAALEPA